MTDQHTVYNSRMFCTRWNGLEKGSIFDDALDDKEYEGNLIYLLSSGSEFIRNNSKVRFVKKAQYRVDKPDYAERAVTEALVNALIHRDYIVLGSEIHIDMFDDRVEITSPGGMFGGGSIQEYDIYPHSKAEIADYCGYKNNKNFTKKYLRPLLDSGTLKMTIPNKPNSRNQKYITVRTE